MPTKKLIILAKPTLVATTKGQGGKDVDQLTGIGIPIKITGTFANPKFGMDLAALGTALAKSNLLDKVGGDKAEAVKGLLGDGNKVDALKGLLGKKKAGDTTAPSDADATTKHASPAEKPKSAEEAVKEKAKEKLNKMLGF